MNTNNLWLNVDSLVLKKADYEKEYEAEDAELISSKVDKHGHVYNFETDGDFIEFTVDAAEAGTYPVSFQYGVESTAVSRHLYVNGELASDSINSIRQAVGNRFNPRKRPKSSSKRERTR